MARNGAKPEKKLALYHIYTQGTGETLTPIGQSSGRNAEHAVSEFLNGSESAAGALTGKTVVIIPDRNMTRVTPQVETKTKVTLRSV